MLHGKQALACEPEEQTTILLREDKSVGNCHQSMRYRRPKPTPTLLPLQPGLSGGSAREDGEFAFSKDSPQPSPAA